MPMKRREINVTVTLLVEGDAPLESVLACLGTDIEDAVRAYQENSDGGFGLPDGCDLMDFTVREPQCVWSNAG